MRTPNPLPNRRTSKPPLAIKPVFTGLLSWLLACNLQAQTTPSPPSPATPARTADRASPCPTHWPTTLPGTKEATRQKLHELSTLEEACETTPTFHAYRGLLLMQAGWLQEAANALEKSLLLAPDQAGVQLDYAQALAELGQKTSARQLVANVAARPDIQPDLRQWLRTGLLPDTSSWSWSAMVQNSLGHDSNLTSATYTDTLTLYLPGGPVQVSLSDSEKPRSGFGLKTNLAVQGLRPLGPGALRVAFALQARHAQNVDHNHLSEALASYDWPVGPLVANLQLSAHHFQEVNQYTYSDTSWRVQMEPATAWNTCKPAPFVGQVRQRYLTNTNLSGQYSHAGLELQCQHSPQAQTTLSLSTGTDQPEEANRPGGAKGRKEITIRHERLLTLGTPLGNSVQGLFKTWLRQSHTQDQTLFSPLLGNDLIRTRRQDIGVAYWWPLAPQWHMGIDVENTSQKSTNSLLNIKNVSLHLGLRWTSKP